MQTKGVLLLWTLSHWMMDDQGWTLRSFIFELLHVCGYNNILNVKEFKMISKDATLQIMLSSQTLFLPTSCVMNGLLQGFSIILANFSML